MYENIYELYYQNEIATEAKQFTTEENSLRSALQENLVDKRSHATILINGQKETCYLHADIKDTAEIDEYISFIMSILKQLRNIKQACFEYCNVEKDGTISSWDGRMHITSEEFLKGTSINSISVKMKSSKEIQVYVKDEAGDFGNHSWIVTCKDGRFDKKNLDIDFGG